MAETIEPAQVFKGCVLPDRLCRGLTTVLSGLEGMGGSAPQACEHAGHARAPRTHLSEH